MEYSHCRSRLFKPFLRILGQRAEFTRSIEPARALAAETLKLERALSDLVNQACGLTPAQSGKTGIRSFLICSGGSVNR
jgi:hypothetical protein